MEMAMRKEPSPYSESAVRVVLIPLNSPSSCPKVWKSSWRTRIFTDEAVLKLSQDYVREVTAHEVGHVLGLRHNFAGSLDADMSPKELDTFIKDYIVGNDLEKYVDRTTSSSSMEYTEFKAAVFIGWKMKAQNMPLEHDKAAIRWGYFDDKEVVEEKCFSERIRTYPLLAILSASIMGLIRCWLGIKKFQATSDSCRTASLSDLYRLGLLGILEIESLWKL